MATPAAARFAPATDGPYRLTMTMARDDGREVRHFATTYDLAFARTREGWRATLRARAGESSDSRATRTFANLQDTGPVVVRLDRHGGLIAVEDIDAHWSGLRARIAAMPVATSAARAARDGLVVAHDAVPASRRPEAIAGDLLAVCAGRDADRATGTRETSLPGSNGTTLPVRETATREGRDVLITAEGGGGSFRRDRRIDRRSGLVTMALERRRHEVRSDGRTMVAITVKEARLTPPVF